MVISPAQVLSITKLLIHSEKFTIILRLIPQNQDTDRHKVKNQSGYIEIEVIIKLGILNIPVRSLWFGCDGDCRRIGGGIVGVWLDRIGDGVRNRSRDGVVEALEVGVAGGDGADVAFPDAEHAPALRTQFGFVAGVASRVALNLRPPEVDVGFGEPIVLATLMAVPEAAVDKDDGLVFRQHYVRTAWQFADLDAETQPSGEKILPDYQFRLGILPLDRRHAAVPLFRCHRIRHDIITSSP